MSKTSFTVCGFGRIGRRHAKIISEYEPAILSSVIDTDDRQQQYLDQLGGKAQFHNSLGDFIEEDRNKTDVINICTPNGMHAPLALQALKAGYHTVIEKPMALSKSECEDIIEASLKNDRRVFVVKQNRYSPPSKWLKEIVDRGVLGKIYSVQVNCYWNRDERYYKEGDWHGTPDLDGGTLFTQFSHFVDILYWVFGDITDIDARFENFSHRDSIAFEDSGIVQFNLKRGGFGTLNYSTSCWDQNMESSFSLIAEKGSLKIGGQYMDEVEYCHIEDYEMPKLEPTNPPNDYGPYKGSAANHHYVIENVVNTLNGSETITTNAMEGMKVVEMIEKIYDQKR